MTRSPSILTVSLLACAVGLACLLLVGCALLPGRQPKVTVGDTTATGPANAGTAPEVRKLDTGTTLPLAAGSTVKVTETAAVAATNDAPAKPAVKVVEITPAKDTLLTHREASTQASAGTVDTSVAKAALKTQAKAPLLYAAIASALAAAFFLWRAYPTPALICGLAGGVFFAAWQLSDVPPWFWAVGLAALAFGAALFFGHERGEIFAKSKPSEPVKIS